MRSAIEATGFGVYEFEKYLVETKERGAKLGGASSTRIRVGSLANWKALNPKLRDLCS
jgi:hypothetical protein